MKMYIRNQKMECDQFAYVDIFKVYPKYPGQRKKKATPTGETQAKLNERHAKLYLEKLLHANFGENDFAVHLTYKLGVSEATATSELTKYLRRVNYARKKAGIEPMKYVAVTEHGEKRGQIHHHLTMDGALPRETIEKIWIEGSVCAGRANARGLQFDENGIAGLSNYIVKEKMFYRRWNSSKNLVKPKEIVKTGRITQKDFRDAVENDTPEMLDNYFPGYKVVSAETRKSELTGCAYISLKMIKTDGWLYKKLEKKRQKFEAAAKRITGGLG